MNEKQNIRHVSSEYSEERARYGDEYRIKTVSEIVTVHSPSIFSSEKDGEAPVGVFAPPPPTAPKRDRTMIKSVVIGTMEEKDGRITLSYEEKLDDDAPPFPTVMEFSPAEPGKLSLRRMGLLNTELLFDEGNYRVCEYVTSVMPFDVCIYTRRLENTVTAQGGTIILDYAMEIRGAATQRVIMKVDVTKL